ncbi:MAG TPA: TIR domain-containing protein [Pyrinomonadaceae bacterium]|nr:TIR domain-containing protein [Pyrinomonadaceae bacterium]
MRTVFVSYSRVNLDAVTHLVADLHAMGVNTWYDQTLTGGQRWWDNILSSIRECDIFLFALSPESWESEACRSELAYGVGLMKPILPVLVSEGIKMNLLSAPLAEIHITDYRLRDKGAAFAVLKAINASPDAPPLPDPLPIAPPVPVSYLGTLKDRIDTHASLSPQEQNLLFLELEEAIDEGRSPAEVRDLLMCLRRRDDLLAKVGTKIDAALKNLDQKISGKSPRKPAPPPPVIVPPAQPGPRVNAVSSLPATLSGCPQCQKHIEPDSQFCWSCGASLSGVSTAPPASAGQIPGSTSRRYACSPDDVEQLLADVRGWLNSQDFDTQQVNTDGDSVLLQIKKRGSWRDFVGMATSLNIVFHTGEDSLTVEIGAGKWIDKAAVGTVSLFILWPLAITAGMGAWEQMKLPDRIFDYIGARLAYR